MSDTDPNSPTEELLGTAQPPRRELRETHCVAGLPPPVPHRGRHHDVPVEILYKGRGGRVFDYTRDGSVGLTSAPLSSEDNSPPASFATTPVDSGDDGDDDIAHDDSGDSVVLSPSFTTRRGGLCLGLSEDSASDTDGDLDSLMVSTPPPVRPSEASVHDSFASLSSTMAAVIPLPRPVPFTRHTRLPAASNNSPLPGGVSSDSEGEPDGRPPRALEAVSPEMVIAASWGLRQPLTFGKPVPRQVPTFGSIFPLPADRWQPPEAAATRALVADHASPRSASPPGVSSGSSEDRRGLIRVQATHLPPLGDQCSVSSATSSASGEVWRAVSADSPSSVDALRRAAAELSPKEGGKGAVHAEGVFWEGVVEEEVAEEVVEADGVVLQPEGEVEKVAEAPPPDATPATTDPMDVHTVLRRKAQQLLEDLCTAAMHARREAAAAGLPVYEEATVMSLGTSSVVSGEPPKVAMSTTGSQVEEEAVALPTHVHEDVPAPPELHLDTVHVGDVRVSPAPQAWQPPPLPSPSTIHTVPSASPLPSPPTGTPHIPLFSSPYFSPPTRRASSALQSSYLLPARSTWSPTPASPPPRPSPCGEPLDVALARARSAIVDCRNQLNALRR